jgi:hypothetical protein
MLLARTRRMMKVRVIYDVIRRSQQKRSEVASE